MVQSTTEPLIKAEAFATLKQQVKLIVKESGRPDGFDAARCLKDWLGSPVGALGGRRPEEYLDTDEGLKVVQNLLGQIQLGMYG